MYKKYFTLSIASLIILAGMHSQAFSQASQIPSGSRSDTSRYPYWIEMMEDPAANFFDVQRAFELYWDGREVQKGSGWKPFKRWEYFMQNRILPDGTQFTSAELYDQFIKYYNTSGEKSSKGNWQELGPVMLPQNNTSQPNGNGRVNCLAFHPADSNVIYAGAASGGFWTSIDGGLTWTSGTDGLPSLGVSAILVDHTNPSVIYMGTGDRDAGDASGVGVMKSIDGGFTWTLSNTGMGNVKVGALLMHPNNQNILIAGTSSGIYRSANAGQSWTLTSASGNYKDLAFNPGNPFIVYSTSSGFFYRSLDNGQSWTLITSILPYGARAVIGVTPAAPNIVYFLITVNNVFQGFYKSSDAGLNFSFRSDSPNIMDYSYTGTGTSGQANYDLAIAIDPLDSNIVYAGGVNVFKSTDGGITWIINSHWVGNSSVPGVHADCHVLRFSSTDGKLYAGNDGGVYHTGNGGVNWDDITSGLAISQIYKIGQSATTSNKVMAGFQDNGTATWLGNDWITVLGGDGMECAVDPTDAAYSYGEVYYGRISRFLNNNNQGNIAGQNINGINESGAWVTPFIIDEDDPNTMFVGYKSVWRSNNIKNASTSNVTWQNIFPGGSSNCKDLEQSPAKGDILYASRSNNTLYRSDNALSANPTWTDLTTLLPGSGLVNDILAHPTDTQIVYIARNRKVYRSENKGVFWMDITGSLPNVPFNCIEYNNRAPEGLYLATDLGVFYRDNFTAGWISFSNGLPATARVTEVDIYYDSINPGYDRIRAATYGRGLWESPIMLTPPQAGFSVSEQTIPRGCSIDFYDNSAGFPTQWEWTFQGGSPSFSSQQHPSGISYYFPGLYMVKLVVRNALGSDSLVKTGYISVSNTLLPEVDFSASETTVCTGNAVWFTDASKFCPTTWQWNFSPSQVVFVNGTTATSQNPVVQFSSPGLYDVSLTVTNMIGSSNTTRSDYIVAGGQQLPFEDDFESGSFNNHGWTIENPDNDVTWMVASTAGNDPGIASASVKLFNTNTLGKRDRLISPPLNLAGLNQAFLSFQYAYAQYQTSVSDSLNVYISGDCGNSWVRIFSGGDDGSGNFATHPPLTSAFIPQLADDWCDAAPGPACPEIDISAFAGLTDVKVMFESRSYMSNNIYIDNVQVKQSIGMNELPGRPDIQLYPNPSSGIVYIKTEPGLPAMDLSVVDIHGREIYRGTIAGNDTRLINVDLTSSPSGIYLFRFISGSGTWLQKIFINR